MDSVEATAVMVEDIPLPGRGAETSVAAVHFQPADSTALLVEAAVVTTEAGVIMAGGVITVAADITALVSDLVSTRLTAILLAYAIREGSMTNTAFGESIPVAQFRMAIEASRRGGPSSGGPRMGNQCLLRH